jgi:ADP-ribosylglycohydrolase
MSNVLLGCAIADSLGVPFEKVLPNDPKLVDWDKKTFLGSEYHGLKPAQYSDDTQMSICVAESLIASKGFDANDLSQRYVNLFTSNTIRGYGRTTKLAIDRLISGTHWSESGVLGSEGNGTAMRAAAFGVYFRNDLYSLINVVKIDSAITHASLDAEGGALGIALASAYAVNNDTEDLIDKICSKLPDSLIKNIIFSLKAILSNSYITPVKALEILGTKANVKETVPSALYCFLKFKTYQEGVLAAIHAGFDADTTAACVGSLFGARDGLKAIPKEWTGQVENRDNLIVLDSKLYNRNNLDYLTR